MERLPATHISRSDDLRRQNKRRILGALRAHPTLSRTGLAAATGLSASTVTAATAELLETGHLVEAPLPAAADETRTRSVVRGRPRIALARRPAAASIAALTITVNEIRVELVDFAGCSLCRVVESMDTATMKREDLGERLVMLVRRTVASAPDGTGPLSSVIVGIQGVVDADGARVHWSPLSPHRDVDLAALLAQSLGTEVRLVNDANLIAAALHHDRPDRFGDDFAVILLSYGVGMGMYLHGELFRGAKTSAAEIGHIAHLPGGALCRCGRLGCVEAYASEYGIWRSATGASTAAMPDHIPDPATIATLAERALAGDAQAVAAYRTAAEAIGRAVLAVFALFDPMTIAFVGSGTLAFEVMEPVIRSTLAGPSTGLSYENAELHCLADNVELMSRGASLTALENLDLSVDVDRIATGS